MNSLKDARQNPRTWKNVPTRSVNVRGTEFAYRELGPGGEVLASGGEYDRLLNRLGATEPVTASGCALWTDRLEAEAGLRE